MQLEQRCEALVEELGLATAAGVREVVQLTGGVASDIAMVALDDRRICVKFALPKLKVAADWQAPVHRNAAEYAWLQVAAEIAPESAVRLYGRSQADHGFAMEYLEGPDVFLWKENLLHSEPMTGASAKVADLIGRIHAASALPRFEKEAFQNRDDFHALRIEPYLTRTREMHPVLTDKIEPLEEMLYTSRQVLVHGDASPKNILFRRGAPIVLDAECATMGDASFDPSFCMNHLLLKAIHRPPKSDVLLQEVAAFWRSYIARVDWEDR